MYTLLVRDGREYHLTKEQVAKVGETLAGGSKWLKLGSDYINTVDITGIANPLVMHERSQRKRGFFKLKDGDWYSKYDTDKNYLEPHIPEENNFSTKELENSKKLGLGGPSLDKPK